MPPHERPPGASPDETREAEAGAPSASATSGRRVSNIVVSGAAVTAEGRAGQTLANGRYELHELLGAGGTAAVYRAVDHALGVTRAVKVLTAGGAARRSLRSRMQVEARAMASLDHPHVLRVYDIGSDGEDDFIVMELAEGASLQDRLDRHGPLPPRAAVSYALQILAALAAAHAAGIVHRDVKPHNVLLDGNGNARLADFGIALLSEDETFRQTRTGMAMGSLAFMAPEQRLDARSVGIGADIYAVGATLYYLLTSASPMDLFAADPHSRRWHGIADGLRAVIARATRYEADQRFPNAQAMARALLQELPDADALPLRQPDPADPNHFPLPSARLADPDDSRLYGKPLPRTFWSEDFRRATEQAIGMLTSTEGPVEIDNRTWLVEDVSHAPTRGVDAPATVPGEQAPRWRRAGLLLAALSLVAAGAAGLAWWLGRPAPLPEAAPVTAVPEPAPVAPAVEEAPAPEPAPAEEPAVDEAPAPVRDQARPSASAARKTGPEASVAGGQRWSGSFGGRVVELTLSGPADALRGAVVVRFGSSSVTTRVAGSWSADGRTLSLRDLDAVDDAGTYVGALSDDGQYVEGTWSSNAGGRVVPFKVRWAR